MDGRFVESFSVNILFLFEAVQDVVCTDVFVNILLTVVTSTVTGIEVTAIDILSAVTLIGIAVFFMGGCDEVLITCLEKVAVPDTLGRKYDVENFLPCFSAADTEARTTGNTVSFKNK